MTCRTHDPVAIATDEVITVFGLARYGSGGESGIITRFTQVWQLRGDEWLITHEHTSMPISDDMATALPQPDAEATDRGAW